MEKIINGPRFQMRISTGIRCQNTLKRAIPQLTKRRHPSVETRCGATFSPGIRRTSSVDGFSSAVRNVGRLRFPHSRFSAPNRNLDTPGRPTVCRASASGRPRRRATFSFTKFLTSVLFFYVLFSGNFRWLFQGLLAFWLAGMALVFFSGLFLKWWVKRNTVKGSCPGCGAQMLVIRGKKRPCQQCSTVVETDGENLYRAEATFSQGQGQQQQRTGPAYEGGGETIDVSAEIIDIDPIDKK
ncbi:hypothetical protein CYMTET_20408 [Cymbomonas tetramitiformis]|uniref:Uncharacterized protein n=1 Tax=Cymbomonas tetramitiformis TaxID=36881 RepID=A0AAE0L414_9CHLO|nr:hypothetical protein CYMTET_20408 [Cymbomonas tetramitiformis]